MLEENVNELKLRRLVYGDLTADNYVNIDYIDFVVCTTETSGQEILHSNLIKNYAEEKEEIGEESSDVPPVKLKLSDIAHAVEILEYWSLFNNSDGEARQ